jgi:hypothetical protein
MGQTHSFMPGAKTVFFNLSLGRLLEAPVQRAPDVAGEIQGRLRRPVHLRGLLRLPMLRPKYPARTVVHEISHRGRAQDHPIL